MLRIGLLLNPLAGIGGPLALKGSDNLPQNLMTQTASNRCLDRVRRTLEALQTITDRLHFLVAPGVMGADAMLGLHFDAEVVEMPLSHPTRSEDTRTAVTAMQAKGVDLLLFGGGDGTARDVCDVLEDGQLALGIPAGVKMQSGVFALTPEAAAEVIVGLVAGRLVDLMAQEVRDIDEAALQQGRVKSSFYGHMQVPQAGRYIQRVKEGSREVEALVLEDIAADFIETLSPGTLYVFGPGTTTRAITEALGLSATLLGIDLVCDGQLLARDANETVLLDLLGKYKERCLVITPTGGQGYLLGRGNQQLSPAVLRLFDTQQIQVVATKTKISALQGRPLLVDTNDLALDKTLSGYRAITTGYRDRIVYPIAAASDFSGGFGPDSWQDGQ